MKGSIGQMHIVIKKSIFLCFVLLTSFSYSQNTKDIKEYIKSYISRYPINENIRNYAYFEDDIMQFHLEYFTGEKVTDEVFPFIFIFGVEIHKGNSVLNEIESELAMTIDLRGVRKIQTFHNKSAKNKGSKIVLYLKKGYLAKLFIKENGVKQIESLNGIMEITIEKNKEIIQKLKKAFISLGDKFSIEIKDGDLF